MKAMAAAMGDIAAMKKEQADSHAEMERIKVCRWQYLESCQR